MRICRFWEPKLGPRLGLVEGEEVIDLTTLDPRGCEDLSSWLNQDDPVAYLQDIAELARRSRARIHIRELDHRPNSSIRHMLLPLDTQEIWAAGVTYERKKHSIMEESRIGGSFYDDVFDAVRPQLIFKATPSRASGPNDDICIRQDSQWTVPECELALIISPAMEVVGYTCGNDVSARDIEGENPLYIQQAKTYVGCCALGPVIAIAESSEVLSDIDIDMVVIRDGMALFRDDTNTSEMRRPLDSIVDALGMGNDFSEGVCLLTGSGVVPPTEFSLEVGDVVEITVRNVGTLRNTVVQHEDVSL
jgi:2-dehydro-3-deoxy-D-arabinonate dehydratase